MREMSHKKKKIMHFSFHKIKAIHLKKKKKHKIALFENIWENNFFFFFFINKNTIFVSLEKTKSMIEESSARVELIFKGRVSKMIEES
jgi:hypothetical protein